MRLPPLGTLFLWCLPALLLFSRALADTTVVLVALTFLVVSYQRNSWAWVKQPWFIAALIFWFYLLTGNLMITVSIDESLKYALTFIRWPVFAAALAYWLLSTVDKQRRFLKALIVVSIFIVLDTGWQYIFGVDWFGIEKFDIDRLTGPFRSPIPGTMMLRVWFIALFALVLWQSLFSVNKLLSSYLFVLGLGFSFVFITGERMALVLFTSGMLVTFIGLLVSFSAKRKWLMAGLILIVAMLITMMLLLPETTSRSVLSFIEKVSDFRNSEYGMVFDAALQVWERYFWLGSGIHTYQSVCMDMNLLTAHRGLNCTHPHNLYLQLGAETGLIGLTLFVQMLGFIYAAALKPAWQAKHWMVLSLSFAVLTVSFWPLTGGIKVFSNWVGALVWLGVGWVLAVSATLRPTHSQRIKAPDYRP